jgi:hypothetical protein
VFAGRRGEFIGDQLVEPRTAGVRGVQGGQHLESGRRPAQHGGLETAAEITHRHVRPDQHLAAARHDAQSGGDRCLDQRRLAQSGAVRGLPHRGAPPRPPTRRDDQPHITDRPLRRPGGFLSHPAQDRRD